MLLPFLCITILSTFSILILILNDIVSEISVIWYTESYLCISGRVILRFVESVGSITSCWILRTNPKKNMVYGLMGPCAGVNCKLTLCRLQSRLKHIYHV